MSSWLFTSESVTEGHPDKVADRISDAVLDAVLAQDPKGRVACETLVTTGLAVVAGEISTSAQVDLDAIARDAIRQVGYDGFDPTFAADTVRVEVVPMLKARTSQTELSNRGSTATAPPTRSMPSGQETRGLSLASRLTRRPS